MWDRFSVCAVVLILSGFGAKAAELPVYEMSGFPITPHQLAVLGPASVEEQAPTGPNTVAGMPASPHQIAVLSPRRKPSESIAAIAPQAGSHQ